MSYIFIFLFQST